MLKGSVFILLGIIYMVGGSLGWGLFYSEMFSFKEVSLLGVAVMLVGCVMCSIESATGDIIKTLKEK
jgi:multisubunit Na+/H+ antiporter MnhG subunit